MLEFLGVSIDFSFWLWFFELPLLRMAAVVFALGGWVFIASLVLNKGAILWVGYRAGKHVGKWKQVLLAVDIPPMFIQTPKAVEQIFAHLTGSLSGTNIYDKFWSGKTQKNFSFEIISIEGYIQFLIRTEEEFRDLIESAIYAQYPEAEITEVEDYVINIPDAYPNAEYDVMGVEFKLSAQDAYPIRTYPEFAYSLSKDAVFSDPMAAILENFTRIAHGENLWMQIVVQPAGNAWKKDGIALAKDVMKGGGGPKKSSGGLLSLFSGLAGGFVAELKAVVSWNFEGGGGEDKPEKVEITPGMRKTVEAIEEKISKVGFKTKLRLLYAARKEVFRPNSCLSGFIGSMNQFHMQDRNAIVPAKSTSAKYDKSKKKTNALKSSFVSAYKKRGMSWGAQNGYILNIEELATLWHFPLPFVKTPLLHKAGHKRSEPPSGLPVEFMENPLKKKGEGNAPELPPGGEPPEELPYA